MGNAFVKMTVESTLVQSPVQMQVEGGCSVSSSNGFTSQQIALGELEFRKAFLILNYIEGFVFIAFLVLFYLCLIDQVFI